MSENSCKRMKNEIKARLPVLKKKKKNSPTAMGGKHEQTTLSNNRGLGGRATAIFET